LQLPLSAAGFTVDSVTTTSLRERKDSFTKSWRFKTGARPPVLLEMAWRVISAVMGLVDNESGEEMVASRGYPLSVFCSSVSRGSLVAGLWTRDS
jgi:hypothetical protein